MKAICYAELIFTEELSMERGNFEAAMSNESATSGLGEVVAPVVIDTDELAKAQQDPRVAALLQEAEAEGAKVAAEGRQHFN